jgi:hypothetical protein
MLEASIQEKPLCRWLAGSLAHTLISSQIAADLVNRSAEILVTGNRFFSSSRIA